MYKVGDYVLMSEVTTPSDLSGTIRQIVRVDGGLTFVNWGSRSNAIMVWPKEIVRKVTEIEVAAYLLGAKL